MNNLYDSQLTSTPSVQNSANSTTILLELILLYNEATKKIDYFWKAYKNESSDTWSNIQIIFTFNA